MYRMSRTFPGLVKRALRSWMKSLVPASFDSDTHFNPSYNPWDERICACPDGDFFKAIRKGKVSVVTDHVECLTTTGVKLKSGIELPADIVVTATGGNTRPTLLLSFFIYFFIYLYMYFFI